MCAQWGGERGGAFANAPYNDGAWALEGGLVLGMREEVGAISADCGDVVTLHRGDTLTASALFPGWPMRVAQLFHA
jgi:hypothetical protein